MEQNEKSSLNTVGNGNSRAEKNQPCVMDFDGHSVRDEKGRFLPGHKVLKGAGANSTQKRAMALRTRIIEVLIENEEELTAIVNKLLSDGLESGPDGRAARRLLFDYIGKPMVDNTPETAPQVEIPDNATLNEIMAAILQDKGMTEIPFAR